MTASSSPFSPVRAILIAALITLGLAMSTLDGDDTEADGTTGAYTSDLDDR